MTPEVKKSTRKKNSPVDLKTTAPKKNSPMVQRMIGFSLLALVVILIIQYQWAGYYDDLPSGESRAKLIGGVVLGFSFGYILSRGSFGFTGPIKKMVLNGDGKQARALVLMMSFSTMAGGAMILGLNGGTDGLSSGSAAGWGSMIGGLIFGIGMICGGGCASGTLTAAGGGLISALYVLVFFIFSSVAGGVATTHLNVVEGWQFLKGNPGSAKSGYYGDLVGGSGIWIAVLLNLVIFGLFLYLIKWVEKYRSKKGTFYVATLPEKRPFSDAEDQTLYFKPFSKRFSYYVFEKRWSWTITAAFLGAFFLFYVVMMNQAPSIVGGYAKWGTWILWLFGYHDVYHVGMTNSAGVLTPYFGDLHWGPLKYSDSMRNGFVILGSLFYFLSSKTFKFKLSKWTWKEWIFLALGGTLMGFGARLAGGCNIGAMWSGISSFSANGWLFTIPLILGVVGAQLVMKKIKYQC